MNGELSTPEWSEYVDTPILLWYPHTPLPHYLKNDKCMRRVYNQNPRMNTADSRYSIFKKNQTERGDFCKDQCSSIFSGECDYPFKIRLVGLENLLKIF